MFAVTKFSYTEVLFLKFALIRVENMVLVNRGFYIKVPQLYINIWSRGSLSYLFFLDQTVKFA